MLEQRPRHITLQCYCSWLDFICASLFVYSNRPPQCLLRQREASRGASARRFQNVHMIDFPFRKSLQTVMFYGSNL